MTVAIVGAGAMGGAILAGLLRGGWDPSEVRASTATEDHRRRLREEHGVAVGPAAEVVRGADAVVVAVKPHVVAEVLAQIAPVLEPDALVVSVAAGLTTTALEAALEAAPAREGTPAVSGGSAPAGAPVRTAFPVVRAMPNIAATVGESMTAICAGSAATANHLARATRILQAVGRVLVVQEAQMDAVTALAGSGPAYLMFVAEAMIDAGVLLGLPRPLATELVGQTFQGSSALLVGSGEHPTRLKESVTSPGGTTIAALRKLEDHGVKAAFIDAVEASYDRSRTMGR